ncbi:hypothetical protein DRO91_06070 [Candidatus Heimdallarchaeota archaeon]|nr:MAG: hypothetical protein DRO91_06070 [Candidatus Heimdallarchaeota archaeon]
MGFGIDEVAEYEYDDYFELDRQEYNRDRKLWEQENGELIHVSKMGTSHIKNTIRMLNKNERVYVEEETWYIKEEWINILVNELQNRR